MALVEQLVTAASSAGTSGSIESRTSQNARNPLSELEPERHTLTTPAAATGFVERMRKNVWLPVLGKALGTLGVLLALSGIGAFAARRGPAGHPVELPERASASAAWMASGPTPSPEPARATPQTPQTTQDDKKPADKPAASSGVSADGKVILNLASPDELRKLPGVGQKRAEAIVALRTKLGKFRRITDLLRVKGIGPKRLKQMLPLLVLDAPPSDAPSAGVSAAK